MAGFMKNAMSYLGMSDVVDDDDEYFDEEDEQQPAAKPSFDSDHTDGQSICQDFSFPGWSRQSHHHHSSQVL